MTVDFKEAYHKFTRQSVPLTMDRKKIDIEGLLHILTEEFKKTFIKGTDEENPDSDMLLFEYGNYDWTGDGLKFNISLKRQIFLKNLDESGYYGFRIYFDPDKVKSTDRYSNWCENKENLNNWKKEIKSTEAFQKVLDIEFDQIEFELEKPH